MSWTLLFVAAFAVLLLLAVMKGKQGGPRGAIGHPYLPAKALFSAAERSFLGVLDQAVGTEYRVFGKVRLADIAAVKPGLSNAARQGALNRISGKHLDFLVCRANDLKIVCAVELNDKSHASKRAQSRDAFVATLCSTIELPLLTVAAKQGYSVHEVRAQFLAIIDAAQAGPLVKATGAGSN